MNINGLSDERDLSILHLNICHNLNVFLSSITEDRYDSKDINLAFCVDKLQSKTLFICGGENSDFSVHYYDKQYTTEGYKKILNQIFNSHEVVTITQQYILTEDLVYFVAFVVDPNELYKHSCIMAYIEYILRKMLDNYLLWILDKETSILKDIICENNDFVISTAISKMSMSTLNVDALNAISSQFYEGQKCEGCLEFYLTPREVKDNISIRFNDSLHFSKKNARKIRKILEVANDKQSIYASGLNHNIYALGKKSNMNEKEKAKIPMFSVNFLGYMSWVLLHFNKPILKFSESKYVIPKNYNLLHPNMGKTIKELFHWNDDYIRDFEDIFNLAALQKHGSLIIITNNAEGESLRLCSCNRGFIVSDNDKNRLNLSKHLDIINSITSIDGAVIIDEYMNCFSIGIILDGLALVKGKSEIGARYNSAYNYIAGKKKENIDTYCAIVFSEDKSIDLITTLDEFEYIYS